MAQGFLVLGREHSVSIFFPFITELVEVVSLLAVDPCTTEEAGSFSLKFTYYLATAHTIVDERVLSTLTIAHYALLLGFHLAEISLLELIDLFFFGCLFALSVGSSLLLLGRFVEFTLGLNSLSKLLSECLDFLFCRIKKAGEVVEDGVFILQNQMIDRGLSVFLSDPP